ncbi:IS21 family transposase [Sphingobacterium thalpophilum]|uniref:IS21 family transposase n=1 Tax=Sphingobacterium thalpophilum TaxID=259 RepID=UPI0024A7045B|nr:IS21 family transposase [Sphingobacterium thalpophilum]
MNYYLNKLMTYHEVHRMAREGFSISKIADHLGMNWRTVKRLLSLSEHEFEHELSLPKGRKKTLEAYTDFVRKKLEAHNDTSAAQMHDWLKEHHQDFPIVSQKTIFNFVHSVRTRYNILKTEAVRDYAMVAELPYGVQGQIDFGFYNMTTTLGKTRKVQFFTFVLSRSRYKYILFQDTPFTAQDVIRAHELAFGHLGGIPKELVYDQDRLFIVSENFGDIILTSEFRAYVKQRGFTTYFCKKADPESKGKVENVVGYVKKNFLYNRSYKDLETLNTEAMAWLVRTANALEHGTTKRIPQEEYDIEKAFLEPWYPIELTITPLPQYAVHKDNKISYKGNLYSLPFGTYKGKNTKVQVKAVGNELIVIDEKYGELCRHEISLLKGQKIISTNHKRDTNTAIVEMMAEFSELMPNKVQAFDWLERIRHHKPRYIRDQIQALTTTVRGLDAHIASRSLDYACVNDILSASDFNAIVEALKREERNEMQTDPKIVQLNPLNGQIKRIAETEPERSDLESYDDLFAN